MGISSWVWEERYPGGLCRGVRVGYKLRWVGGREYRRYIVEYVSMCGKIGIFSVSGHLLGWMDGWDGCYRNRQETDKKRTEEKETRRQGKLRQRVVAVE